jgi:hypothetical protein
MTPMGADKKSGDIHRRFGPRQSDDESPHCKKIAPLAPVLRDTVVGGRQG